MKNNFFRPFERIAGVRALAWGLLGITASTLITRLTGFHYHGLLQAGPMPNNAAWIFAVERVVIWLVPALLFYLGGVLLSKSRIRPIDIFGTVAFAQIPLIGFDLTAFVPALQRISTLDMEAMSLAQLSANTDLLVVSLVGLVGVAFMVWALVWMFHALRVSCNLRGWALWTVYAVGVIGGDVLCRLLNPLFYA